MKFDGTSILLPVYLRFGGKDHFAQLRRAVVSVLSQESVIPFEVIVIDDGSFEALSELEDLNDIFCDPRIRYVRLYQNTGLVYALNVGLNLAQYELIGRIDSDDEWRPEKLIKQLALFSSDPDLTIVGTGMRVVYDNPDRCQDHIRPGTWHGILRFTAEVGCPFPHGSILARKSILWLMGGYSHDVKVAHCEDFALWATWLRFFKGAMIEEVLYDYRVSEGAVSARYADQQLKATREVLSKFVALANYEKIPNAMNTVAQCLNKTVLEAGCLCFLAWRFYDFIVAEGDLLQALKILLPDRQVVEPEEIEKHMVDRFVFFAMDECRGGSHVRVRHNIKDLVSILSCTLK
jgi:glycosyltransferase involved in cell wall biosynthesis